MLGRKSLLFGYCHDSCCSDFQGRRSGKRIRKITKKAHKQKEKKQWKNDFDC